MKGREIIFCAGFFIAGNFLGDILPLYAGAFLAAGLCAALLARRFASPAAMLAAMMMLGAAGVQAGRIPDGAGTPALRQAAAAAQSRFSAWLGTLVPEGDELGVLRALAIGDKGSLPRDLRAAYRASGAMHLLALSGLHVGIIYAFASALLSVLGGSRPMKRLRTLLILAFLWCYALVSGLSPSICRAVIMITIYEISGMMCLTRDGPSSIAASALLITLFNPEAPRDIGFQLSYAAVISIYTIYPKLSALLSTRSRLLTYIWNTLSIALSCQATCGVLAWLYFGNFPRYFMLTNLLAVPLATLAMYTVAVSLAAAAIPAAAPVASQAMLHALRAMNSLVRFIADLP